MNRRTRITALVTAAGFLAAWNGAFAQTASQNDFDECNRQAQAALGTSSTRSVSGTGAGGTLSSGGSTVTSPGSSDANRMPNSSGRISGSPGSPGTDSGAVSGSPSASPSTSGTPSGSSAGAGGTMSGSSSASSGTGSTGGSMSSNAGGAASTTSDARLSGMSPAGAGSAAYQQAYGDCMRRRGF